MITSPPMSQRLFLESCMESPESVSVTGGNVVALCRRCPDKTEPNDDSAAIISTAFGAVLIVADGVGGAPLGYKASAIAVQAVAENVQAAHGSTDLRPAILDGIETANREILDLGMGSATTLSVVDISNSTARAYQVGDSMTLIVGQRGSLKWKSTSHSPVGYAIESGLIDEAEAMHHDDRHYVSNLVGTRSMHIEVGPSHQLAPRDSILVASDGLFDNLHLAEIIERCRSGKPVRRMNELMELAARRMLGQTEGEPGKPDDLTVLLFTPS